MPDTVLPVRETLAPFELLDRLIAELEKVFHGKQGVVQLAIASLLARGYLVFEDILGVGKTTLAHALSRTLSQGPLWSPSAGRAGATGAHRGFGQRSFPPTVHLMDGRR